MLQDLVTNKCEDYHISLLTPFHYDVASVNLKDIANRDYHLRELYEVTAHEGVATRRADMRFLCTFKDQPDERVWLPWKEIYKSPILQDYLYAQLYLKIQKDRCKKALRHQHWKVHRLR